MIPLISSAGGNIISQQVLQVANGCQSMTDVSRTEAFAEITVKIIVFCLMDSDVLDPGTTEMFCS